MESVIRSANRTPTYTAIIYTTTRLLPFALDELEQSVEYPAHCVEDNSGEARVVHVDSPECEEADDCSEH